MKTAYIQGRLFVDVLNGVGLRRSIFIGSGDGHYVFNRIFLLVLIPDFLNGMDSVSEKDEQPLSATTFSEHIKFRTAKMISLYIPRLLSKSFSIFALPKNGL
ncbi:MAG: hypothetical protein WBG48_18930 [Pricia sp.]